MCGLYGIITVGKNGFTSKEMKVLADMMVMTSLLGSDSSGMFAIDNKGWNKSPKIHRNLGDPYYFLHNEEIRAPILDMLYKNGAAVIGHGRYATKGSVTLKNAHPFKHKHITLVHNGTLFGETSEEKEAEVDSHHLCINIAEKGYQDALTDTQGAFALIWHDADEGCIYIARNSQRPLHLLTVGHTRFIMSRDEGLEYIAKVHSLRGYTQPEPISYFKENIVYKIKPDGAMEKVFDIAEARYSQYQKKYQAPNNVHPIRGSSKSNGILVKFIVDGVSNLPHGGFKYFGTTEEKERVVFYTDKELSLTPALVGEASVHSVIYIGQDKEELFVKYREIVWDEMPVIVGNKQTLLISYNNKAIPVDKWKELSGQQCAICRSAIGSEDCHHTIVDDKEKLMCRNCIDDVVASGLNPLNYSGNLFQ